MGWSPKDLKDYENFLKRLRWHIKRLEIMDVNYRPLDCSSADQTAAREFERVKNSTNKFEDLIWVGFVSNATKTTVRYLDGLKLANRA